MSFDIYDVSSYERETAADEANESDKVELNLSPGELRQSLMDRVRADVDLEEAYFLNLNFSTHGLTIEEEDFEDEESSRSFLLDAENIIYDLVDDCMDGSFWEFSNERLLIRGEQ